jgi:hypothetical protein
MTTTMITLTIFTGMFGIQIPEQYTMGEICNMMGEDTFVECDNKDVFDGYWWLNQIWVPGYLSVNSWFTPSPNYFSGNAVFYSEGVAIATARSRGLDLNGYLDGVSLMSPADIGMPVWLKRPGSEWEGPFLVIDSATRGDIYPIIVYRGEAVEVGFRTALSWGMVNEEGDVSKWRIENVEVSKLPPEFVKSASVDFVDWWLTNAYEPATNRELYTPVYRAPSTWKIGEEWVTFSSPIHHACEMGMC